MTKNKTLIFYLWKAKNIWRFLDYSLKMIRYSRSLSQIYVGISLEWNSGIVEVIQIWVGDKAFYIICGGLFIFIYLCIVIKHTAYRHIGGIYRSCLSLSSGGNHLLSSGCYVIRSGNRSCVNFIIAIALYDLPKYSFLLTYLCIQHQVIVRIKNIC